MINDTNLKIKKNITSVNMKCTRKKITGYRAELTVTANVFIPTDFDTLLFVDCLILHQTKTNDDIISKALCPYAIWKQIYVRT